MTPMPIKLRALLQKDPFMNDGCIRANTGECKGRVTWEHCWKYAGRRINERWSLVPLCVFHHFESLEKGYGQYISLLRATKEELAKYPRENWAQLLKYLASKYESIRIEYENWARSRPRRQRQAAY